MITLIIIYLVSGIGTYLTIRKVFGPGGEYSSLNPGFQEFMFIFIPGLNMFISLVGVVGIVVDWIKSFNIQIDYNRIFRIKKQNGNWYNNIKGREVFNIGSYIVA